MTKLECRASMGRADKELDSEALFDCTNTKTKCVEGKSASPCRCDFNMKSERARIQGLVVCVSFVLTLTSSTASSTDQMCTTLTNRK